LLEKEVVEGAEVAEMLKAYREGRPLATVQQPLAADNQPSDQASTAKPKPRSAAEEDRLLPGLQPKPSLA
jgi:hypothetical protein